jgi:Protein tyrosine and serine/threonine kinase
MAQLPFDEYEEYVDCFVQEDGEVASVFRVQEIKHAIVHNDLRPTFPSWCPKPFAELARRCWQRAPEDRPSFKQCQHELQRMLDPSLPPWSEAVSRGCSLVDKSARLSIVKAAPDGHTNLTGAESSGERMMEGSEKQEANAHGRAHSSDCAASHSGEVALSPHSPLSPSQAKATGVHPISLLCASSDLRVCFALASDGHTLLWWQVATQQEPLRLAVLDFEPTCLSVVNDCQLWIGGARLLEVGVDKGARGGGDKSGSQSSGVHCKSRA